MNDTHSSGSLLQRCCFPTDHKGVALQYLVTSVMMALLGGGLALLIRIQLTWAESEVVTPETYLSIVTLHGTIMVFFVVALALFSGVGHFVVPLMCGARNLAVPWLSALSVWVVVPGCLCILLSLFVEGGGAAFGWTAYPPLSILKAAGAGSDLGQTLWLVAMVLFVTSFMLSGVNFVLTILRCRAPGLALNGMPLTVWSYLIAAILGVATAPALLAAMVMLLMDRFAETSFFLPEGIVIGGTVLPASGGTPLLFQHLFWFFGHPFFYVLAFPAIGIAFDITATCTRRPPAGYRTSVIAMCATAVLSLVSWGHHMYVSGMDPALQAPFSIATVLIALPFALLGINLLLSLRGGHLRMESPMLFVVGLISLLGAGGLGGMFLGVAAADVYLHETYFVVGHLHLMMGWMTLLGTFAALYYWFPKCTGRVMNERLARWHFWLTIVPTFAMFILMHFQGLAGSLRRIYDASGLEFADAAAAPTSTITYLAFVATAAQFLLLCNLVMSAWRGAAAPANPWDSGGLEWTTPTPAPPGNWPGDLPQVNGSYYMEIVKSSDDG